MAQTVADVLVGVLERVGVRQIFGLIGDSLNPLADSVRHSSIEWIGVRHEEGAALAAAGQAKLTGRLAVCAGTTGPGSNHLVAGLYEAAHDHAPVLAISGDMPRKLHGIDYFQSTKPDLLFRDVSLYTETIITPEQAPAVIHQAIAAAYAGRGVAHLTLPQDVVLAHADGDVASVETLQPRPEIVASAEDVARIASRIDAAGSVLIMCGAGCHGAAAELKVLSDRLKSDHFNGGGSAPGCGCSGLNQINQTVVIVELRGHGGHLAPERRAREHRRRLRVCARAIDDVARETPRDRFLVYRAEAFEWHVHACHFRGPKRALEGVLNAVAAQRVMRRGRIPDGEPFRAVHRAKQPREGRNDAHFLEPHGRAVKAFADAGRCLQTPVPPPTRVDAHAALGGGTCVECGDDIVPRWRNAPPTARTRVHLEAEVVRRPTVCRTETTHGRNHVAVGVPLCTLSAREDRCAPAGVNDALRAK